MRQRISGFGACVATFFLQGCGLSDGSGREAAPVPAPEVQGSHFSEISLGSSSNPFEGADLFVDPRFVSQVDGSIQRSPDKVRELGVLKQQSTAIWMDKIARLSHLETALEAARSQQRSSGRPVAITFVVYNLPERDCSANASNGEINVNNGGIARYKSEYIEPIAQAFAKYNDLRIVAIVEPDSLPNLATNMGVSRCQLAAPLYREGVAYALQRLNMPHVSLYLDIAHGGWLGWNDNRAKVARVFREVLDAAGGSNVIRGFASNVANYSPLRRGEPDLLPDSYYQWNPARDELTYVQLMEQSLAAEGIQNRQFIIDTSRNGNPVSRNVWGNWCNIANAGIGQRPTVSPVPGIDAYLWIKIPGESDGVSDPNAQRFDYSCQSADSIPGAPQAGEWFHDHLIKMVERANPPL